MTVPEEGAKPVEEPVEDFFAPARKNSGSLQDSFAAFRAKKLAEAKEKKSRPAVKRTQAQKDALRAKWVEQLKSYIGIPYAKRYVEECYTKEDEEKGLFLDCCGLLRQASQDLGNDFGWALGRWNQTYQFALCSKEIEEKDMKPGDIIFYEATYLETWKKPQHFDITHIEVYLGPERQSIGSRWKQRVSLHDTWELGTEKHPSKLWNCHKFHFRSIEPWLEGGFPEWAPALAEEAEKLFPTVKVTGKKSIFFTDDNQDADGDE